MILNINKSLTYPYLTYGIAAWGQEGKTYLKEINSPEKDTSFAVID